jgi:hypothetical protein
MKKYLVLVVLAIATMTATVGLTAPAANAYPETSCDAQVTAQVVASGTEVDSSGTSHQFTSGRTSAFAAVHWTVTFNGEVRHSTGVSFHQVFKAPVVTVRTVFTLTAEAVMPDEKTTCHRTLQIAVEPATVVSPPGGPGLPGTGGPRLIILILAVLLLGGGGIAAVAARRKR